MAMLVDENIDPIPGESWPLFLVFPQMLYNVILAVLAHAPQAWLLAFAALFVSHGVSFIVNFIMAGERKRTNPSKLMMTPYSRIVILHIAIMLGGFAVMAIGQPVAMLIVLILLKLGVDVKLHVREHSNLASQPTLEASSDRGDLRD